MKTITLLLGSMLLCGTCTLGCSHEVSHEDSNTGHWTDNGRTKESKTTYQNSDGSTSTDQSKTVTH
jgi:hypothetical protein